MLFSAVYRKFVPLNEVILKFQMNWWINKKQTNTCSKSTIQALKKRPIVSFIVKLWTYFTPFSNVCITDLEYVNVGIFLDLLTMVVKSQESFALFLYNVMFPFNLTCLVIVTPKIDFLDKFYFDCFDVVHTYLFGWIRRSFVRLLLFSNYLTFSGKGVYWRK